MNHSWILPDGRSVDLRYFVKWRPWLWTTPLRHALQFLGDLRGRTVLDIGGKDGRISSLLALCGAEVTMVDLQVARSTESEITKWGVGDRVKLRGVHGLWDELANQRFDVILTKSVLVFIIETPSLFSRLDESLAPEGRVVFLENYRGGPILFALRRLFRGTGGCPNQYKGITHEQLSYFRAHFENVRTRRHLGLVWEIFGHKRSLLANGARAASATAVTSAGVHQRFGPTRTR